jgi:23S rRNA (adenine2503-C2)-methyltransferase
MKKVDLKSLKLDRMEALVRSMGWPTYRSRQLLQWIYQKRIRAVAEMTNLSKIDRRALEDQAIISRLEMNRHLRSSDGTEKFLYNLSDGQSIETVLIPGEDTNEPKDPLTTEAAPWRPGSRLTLCISTQVGCSLDCRFCLTGTMGLIRNLEAHEIVDQVLVVQQYLGESRRLTNIVLMGMGEPLANFHDVMEALTRLTHSQMVAFPPRRITLSTSGLVPQIRRLGESGLGIHLAVSLNATTDAVRRKIMPAVHQLYPLKDLMAACRSYPAPPRRGMTFEYVLLAGVNDTENDAKRLVQLVRGIPCKINLIPFNEFPGAPYQRPEDSVVLRFQKTLSRAGLPVFIRKSRGRDILAACGQLRTETGSNSVDPAGSSSSGTTKPKNAKFLISNPPHSKTSNQKPSRH